MSFLKKYWWIVAGALIYLFWDKIKPMLGGLTSGTAPAPEPTPTPTPTPEPAE
jgi:hypothetical protein